MNTDRQKEGQREAKGKPRRLRNHWRECNSPNFLGPGPPLSILDTKIQRNKNWRDWGTGAEGLTRRGDGEFFGHSRLFCFFGRFGTNVWWLFHVFFHTFLNASVCFLHPAEPSNSLAGVVHLSFPHFTFFVCFVFTVPKIDQKRDPGKTSKKDTFRVQKSTPKRSELR